MGYLQDTDNRIREDIRVHEKETGCNWFVDCEALVPAKESEPVENQWNMI